MALRFEDVAEILRLATERTIMDYSGGRVARSGEAGGRRNRAAKELIMNSHFTRGNAAFYPALSPGYLKWKQKKVGNQPILVFSASMKDSLLNNGLLFAVGRSRYRLTFPKAKDYAKYHATGGPNLPKRQPTALTPNDLRDWKFNYSKNFNALAAAKSRSNFKFQQRR